MIFMYFIIYIYRYMCDIQEIFPFKKIFAITLNVLYMKKKKGG